MKDLLDQGKKWVKWSYSRRDYLAIQRVLDLDEQGKVKLCNKCKKSLSNNLKDLKKMPYKLCKFCDAIIEVNENVCPKCNKSQI